MNGQTIFSPVEQVDEIQSIKDISNALANIGLQNSAKQLVLISEIEPEDLGSGVPLTLSSALSFYKFLRNKYFSIEPDMGLSDEGEIQAYWNLSNNETVWVYFLNNNNLSYFIKSATTRVTDTTTIDNIYQIFTESKVSRC